MVQPPPVRLNTVVEQLSNGRYFIYDSDGGQRDFAPDSPAWFAWLDGHTSFHFTSKQGHFSARQEKKQRGAGYWYAYRRAYHHRYKRYLGTTETLTVAKLEQTARALHEEALGAIPDKEVLNTSASQQVPEELTLGPLTFRWHEEVLRIKTPTESHYLNKTQAAGLLGYLYDQRRTILKKSR
jgi:LuxR family maltose regulon positive regulatory protein